MHMPVRVPGQRGHAPRAGQRDLRAQLGRDFVRADPAGEQSAREFGEAKEPALAVTDARDRGRVAHRPTPDEIEMDADFQVALGERLRGAVLAGRERQQQAR